MPPLLLPNYIEDLERRTRDVQRRRSKSMQRSSAVTVQNSQSPPPENSSPPLTSPESPPSPSSLPSAEAESLEENPVESEDSLETGGHDDPNRDSRRLNYQFKELLRVWKHPNSRVSRAERCDP